MKQKTPVFIAEFSSELRVFLKFCENNGRSLSDFLIVALQPEVKALCKKIRLTYVDTLPFFNNESHKKILNKSHQLTTLIGENLAFGVDPQLEKVFLDTFVFYARFYINNYLWIIEVLKGIKNHYKDVELFLVKNKHHLERKYPVVNPYMSKMDQFILPLAEIFCEKNGIKVHVIEGSVKAKPTAKKVTGTNSGGILKRLARRIYRIKLKNLSTYPSVFVTTTSYNLVRVGLDIQNTYSDVITVSDLQGDISPTGYLRICLKEFLAFLGSRFTKKRMENLPMGIFIPNENSAGKEMSRKINAAFDHFSATQATNFKFEGCPIWEEFRKKTRSDLLTFLVRLFYICQGQRVFLDLLKPKLLISPVSTASFHCWAMVAGSLDIPTLVIPQKTLLVPADDSAKIEEKYIGQAQVSDTFAYAAAQSPLVTEYLKWTEYKGEILETGNLVFARTKAEEKAERQASFFEGVDSKQIIVWAPSMKTRRSRRFFVIETIDELTNAMEEVFEVISRLEDVHLIFRIHPGDAITRDEIYSLLPVPKNVSVSDSESFEEVLAICDLLLSYSSTAVQEALINHVPVLLYDKWQRYNHLKGKKVNSGQPQDLSPIYYLDKRESLAPSIKWILSNHAKTKTPVDFFSHYAFSNDTDCRANFVNFVGTCLGKNTNHGGG
jgi:hypothetical protein